MDSEYKEVLRRVSQACLSGLPTLGQSVLTTNLERGSP